MTQLLERAFGEAAKLPDTAQDAVGQIVLDELASEKKWAQSFATSQDQLAAMARDALKEFEADETLPMDVDRDFTND